MVRRRKGTYFAGAGQNIKKLLKNNCKISAKTLYSILCVSKPQNTRLFQQKYLYMT